MFKEEAHKENFSFDFILSNHKLKNKDIFNIYVFVNENM